MMKELWNRRTFEEVRALESIVLKDPRLPGLRFGLRIDFGARRLSSLSPFASSGSRDCCTAPWQDTGAGDPVGLSFASYKLVVPLSI